MKRSFPEFRSPSLVVPLIGNTVVGLAYLLTRSPKAPMGAHIAMRVAAVLHGPDPTVPQPPHYPG